MAKIKLGLKLIAYGIMNPVMEALIFCLPQNRYVHETEAAILSGALGFLIACCIIY